MPELTDSNVSGDPMFVFFARQVAMIRQAVIAARDANEHMTPEVMDDYEAIIYHLDNPV